MPRLLRKPRARGQRYTVTLGPRLDDELEEIAIDLGITKAEAFRRALTLYKHAVNSDGVILKKGNSDQTVLVK